MIGFGGLDDVGAMYPDETLGGELLFQRFEACERQHGAGFVLDVNLYVVLESFDVEDFISFDLPKPVFGLDEDAFGPSFCRRWFADAAALEFEPFESFVGGRQEVGIADRLEQVIHAPTRNACDGISVERPS